MRLARSVAAARRPKLLANATRLARARALAPARAAEAAPVLPPGMSEFAARWIFEDGPAEGTPFAGGASIGEDDAMRPPAFLDGPGVEAPQESATPAPSHRLARDVSRGKVEEISSFRLARSPAAGPRPSDPVTPTEPAGTPDVDDRPERDDPAEPAAQAPAAVEAPPNAEPLVGEAAVSAERAQPPPAPAAADRPATPRPAVALLRKARTHAPVEPPRARLRKLDRPQPVPAPGAERGSARRSAVARIVSRVVAAVTGRSRSTEPGRRPSDAAAARVAPVLLDAPASADAVAPEDATTPAGAMPRAVARTQPRRAATGVEAGFGLARSAVPAAAHGPASPPGAEPSTLRPAFETSLSRLGGGDDAAEPAVAELAVEGEDVVGEPAAIAALSVDAEVVDDPGAPGGAAPAPPPETTVGDPDLAPVRVVSRSRTPDSPLPQISGPRRSQPAGSPTRRIGDSPRVEQATAARVTRAPRAESPPSAISAGVASSPPRPAARARPLLRLGESSGRVHAVAREAVPGPAYGPVGSAIGRGARMARATGGSFDSDGNGMDTVVFPASADLGQAAAPAAPVLMRAEAEPASPVTTTQPESPPAPAAPFPVGHVSADMDDVYEHVVDRLRRDLLAERERMSDLLGDLP
jgi:hypothetical protein